MSLVLVDYSGDFGGGVLDQTVLWARADLGQTIQIAKAFSTIHHSGDIYIYQQARKRSSLSAFEWGRGTGL